MKKLILTFVFMLVACDNLLGDKTKIDSDIGTAESTAVQIVTAPGGLGAEVTTPTVTDGAALTLYAVVIDTNGDYVEDADVTWSMTNSLGTLSTTTGSSTVFTPNAAGGSEVITATHLSLTADSTGSIDVDFTVENISGLEAWYKADSGVTYDGSNFVSSWSDLSGNSHDATQGTGSEQPTFVSASINSLPVIRFDGSDDVLETAASVVNGTGARTVFIVAEDSGLTGSYNAFMDFSNTVVGSGSNYGITHEVAVRISGNRVFNEGFSTGVPAILAITHGAGLTSSSIEAYIDGVQATQASVSAQTINTLNNNMMIGEAAFTNSNCNCDIAEIVIYSEELSTTDRQAVESYLSDKYGI